MHPVPLESTLLASVSYHRRQHLLKVEFRTGDRYRYFHVPSACYQGLLRANSKGSYFNHNIRNCFLYQHLSRRLSPVVLNATKTK
jgi:hypothetical protein